MNTLYQSPIALMLRELNNSGQVLAGGLVNIYQAFSATPQLTYTDASGTTLNGNPIILDSSGKLPTSIWVPTNTPHKLVLTDIYGNGLYFVDNLIGINDPYAITSGIIPSNTVTEIYGSFIAPISGFTKIITSLCKYYIHNNVVTMTIGSFLGTKSVNGILTMTNIPSSITPVTSKMSNQFIVYWGSAFFSETGSILFSPNTSWSFYNETQITGWSGNCGLPFNITLRYDLS